LNTLSVACIVVCLSSYLNLNPLGLFDRTASTERVYASYGSLRFSYPDCAGVAPTRRSGDLTASSLSGVYRHWAAAAKDCF